MNHITVRFIDPTNGLWRIQPRQAAIDKPHNINAALFQFAAKSFGVVADSAGLRRP